MEEQDSPQVPTEQLFQNNQNKHMKEITQEFKLGLEGFYKVAVVGADGNEIWRQPEWEKNLILNQGMDMLPSFYLAEVMRYGVAGTGSRVNSITSSASSASVILGGLVLDPQPGGIQNFDTEIWGGWSGSLATGDIIRFNDGTEVKVGGVGSTTCAVTPTDTVSSQSFTIWKTSQTEMQYESKRGGSGIVGSSYLTGVGNCGSSISENVVTYLRTYDFAVEVSPTTYAEVGVSRATSGVGTTFSRILLPVTVSIDTGQRLRLVYQLQVTFLPTSSQYVSNAIVNGWPVAPSTNTNMTESIQQILVSSINTNGVSATTITPLEPASTGNQCAFWASTNSQSLVTFGNTPVNRDSFGTADTTTSTQDVYIAGSYTLYKNGTFGLSQMNYQDLASFGFGYHSPTTYYAYRSTGQSYAMLFEQTQSKYNTQTLSFTYRWTWSRVLA